MPRKTLKRLTIEHLRGASRPFVLEFEKSKQLTLIYGENGTGKTTVCDALDFLGNGRVGSLEGRGLGKLSKYWNSVGKRPTDVSVTLETVEAIWQATVRQGTARCIPADERPKVEVLRRPRIQSLVADTEGHRYEAIKRFIDVSLIEETEREIRDSINQQSARLDAAAGQLAFLEEQLANLWQQAGGPGADALSWAAEQNARNASLYTKDVADLDGLRITMLRLQDAVARTSEANQRHLAALELQKIAQEALIARSDEVVFNAHLLVPVLTSASAYLAAVPLPVSCPLCESNAAVEGLGERVSQRLSSLNALREATETLSATSRDLTEVATRLRDEEAAVAQCAALLNEGWHKRVWPSAVTFPDSPAPELLTDLANWLPKAATVSESWREVQNQWERSCALLTTVQETHAQLLESREEQRHLEKVLPNLQRTIDIVAEERKRLTDEILSEIASEVGRMYEAVHPSEGLSKITLALDPKKRASLEIGTSFGGTHDQPAQAYLSDSHLETLGLCVFLALAARENPEETILVLDDVLGSVDEPHVDRLVEMLYNETSRFRHCVVTTHYRPWKQKLRWGWLQNGECQFVELTKWTLDEGMRLIGSVPEVGRLRALLVAPEPDPQQVAAKAGIILEAILDFITLQYECPVPRKADGLYTLGDLLSALDKKLKKALRIEIKENDAAGASIYRSQQLEPLLDELRRIAQVRNALGAHFNKLSFELKNSDALDFGATTLKLAELVIDEERGWPRRNKSGSYWETSGDTRRMHPLTKPE
jgi:ABC-type molybdenum transport system ATPase subunit/photorepair protein PhrA